MVKADILDLPRAIVLQIPVVKNLFPIAALVLLTVSGSAQSPELTIPVGHTMGVSSVHFSPDDKYVVTASHDKTAKVWETSTGRLLTTLAGSSQALNNVEFSPSGKYVITFANSAKPQLIVLDPFSGKLVRTFDGVRRSAAAFSPDDQYIFLGNKDGIVRMVDVLSGDVRSEFRGSSATVTHVEVNSSRNLVLATTLDGVVRIWEVSSGSLLQNIAVDPQGLGCVRFSKSGELLITAGLMSTTAKVWSVTSGKLYQELKGRDKFITTTKFSHNEKFALTTAEGYATVWDLASARAVFTSRLIDDKTFDVSSNGKYLLYSEPGGMKLTIHETTTGKSPVLTYPGSESVKTVAFSNDGELVAIGLFNNLTELREASSGKLITTLRGYANLTTHASFSSDQRFILTSNQDRIHNFDSTARIWEVATGRMSVRLGGLGRFMQSVEFSRDDKYVVATGAGKVRIWDAQNGKTLTDIQHPFVRMATFSPDGTYVAIASSDEILLSTVADGKVYRKIAFRPPGTDERNDELIRTFYPVNARFSPDGKFVAATAGTTVRLWVAESGKPVVNGTGHASYINNIDFSPEGGYFVTSSWDGSAKVWQTQTGLLIHTLAGHSAMVSSARFSPDGRYVLTVSHDSKAKMWETKTGKLIREFAGHTDRVTAGIFSPDGRAVVTASADKTIRVWNIATGTLEQNLEGHTGPITSIDFRKDGKYIVSTSEDLSCRLWNVVSGREALAWYSIGWSDWAVTSPSGVFDASNGAMEKMYFKQEAKLVALGQLKDRYYEPGLWSRIIGGEKSRNVQALDNIAMPPLVTIHPVDASGYLQVDLINRGGGIGEVGIYVQGKEIVKDARDKNASPDAQSMSIRYFIANLRSITEGENFIAVKAWNKDHWIESRSEVVTYTKAQKKNYRPSVHILACGVSDYSGDDIDLTYAAKDAQDIGSAMKLGAHKLFGAERSFLYTLTTAQKKESWPTKENIINALKKIEATSHPLDIVVVYLSGHGISLGGPQGDWHYLTQEASVADGSGFDNPTTCAQTTISSTELLERFNAIPAAKQVLIIDACASGNLVSNLIASRNVPSSTLRALDRMSDRTGMHIITGCAADAVSYEASRYGQGVLTYSLLEGIRGAALRDDEFIDVNKLFQYAQERVPFLAEGIGGIQMPMVFSPQGSQSFDVGQLTEVEKNKIPLSRIRPVYISSSFQDEDDMTDVIGLGRKVDILLRESATRSSDSPLVFVPAGDYPDCCQFVGRYKRQGGTISLRLKKKCENNDVTMDLTGANADELAARVVETTSGR